MENFVVPLFGAIESRNVEPLVFPYKEHPWGPEQLGHKIHIVPRNDVKILKLVFPTPDIRHQYKTSVSLFKN